MKKEIVIDHHLEINLPNVVSSSLYFVVSPYIYPIPALCFHVVSSILQPSSIKEGKAIPISSPARSGNSVYKRMGGHSGLNVALTSLFFSRPS